MDLLPSDPENYNLQPRDPEHRYASTASYLGPGSSAELLDNLLNTLVRRQLAANNASPSQLPKFISKLRDGHDEHSLSFPALNLKINPGKLETQSLQHPQIQRALVEYYAKAVQPSFPLLSPDQLRLLLGYENPLRQSANDSEKLLVHGMLAISSALVARDLDRDQSLAASLWAEKLFDHFTRIHSTDGAEPVRALQTILSLCFLTLLELVSPGSSRGSVWEIVGSASRMFSALCEESGELDDDCQRIGFCLFAFERSLLPQSASVFSLTSSSILACHFHRPSLFCNSAPPRLGLFSPEYDFLTRTFQAYRGLYSISQHFILNSDPSPADLEALISPTLNIPPGTRPSDMSLAQAQIYLALHPLFTSPAAGPHSCSPELLSNIAGAASAFIGCISKLNREHRVICIWSTTESVLQAGAVWGAYLILSKQGESKLLKNSSSTAFQPGSSVGPLLQCSALLASFAERWKPGRHYVQAWDAFVEMLWADLDLQRNDPSPYQVQNGVIT